MTPTDAIKHLPIVYVAGPFRAANTWEIEQNIRRAEALALEVWRHVGPAICPHTNTRFYQGAAPDDVWLNGDLAILDRCDAVILVEGWERSSGTRAEVAWAQEAGVPVFQSLPDLLLWKNTGRLPSTYTDFPPKGVRA